MKPAEAKSYEKTRANESTDESTSPRPDHPGRGRRRVLKAAETEFSEGGFDGASMAGIAAAAGVTKSTVFHHFESKEALYLAVIEDAAVAFRRKMDKVLDPDQDLPAALTAFQAAHLDHIQRNACVARLVLREIQQPDSDHARYLMKEVFGPNLARLRSYLEAARQRGTVRAEVDPGLVAVLLIAANVFHFQSAGALEHVAGFGDVADSGRFAAGVIDLLCAGLVEETPSR